MALDTIDTKKWYQSTTVWSAVLTFVAASVGTYFKWEFPTDFASALSADIVTMIGAALTGYGRIKAVKKIK